MMAVRGYLIFIKHDGRDGSVYPVTTPSCFVGRARCNDVRIFLPSVSQTHCVIHTSEHEPAVLENLSRANPTEVNNAPIHKNQHTLEHGDIITTGERSFRWEYIPQSQYFIPSRVKGTRHLPASSLPGSTGMVGMPISVLQSTLGSQPFSRQSVVITERKLKLSPVLMDTNRQATSSGEVQFTPSKLVAVVSPQRRSQTEKKSAEVTSVSSPAGTSVTESRNQTPAKSVDMTPSNRKSSRLYSKSARMSTGPHGGVKTLQHKQSWQALVTTRKTPKSAVGTPRRSRIPRLMYNFKHSGTGMSQSSKKSSNSSGNSKKMTAVSSVRKTKSEQKQPIAATAQERKRGLECGLRCAERAAKRLKLESPKTPDKKKMAALLVCHRKVPRPKTPQVISSIPHEVAGTPAVKSMRRSMTAASTSCGIAVRKTARKDLQTSVGGETPSRRRTYSLEIPASFNISSRTAELNISSGENHKVKESPLRLSQNSRRSPSNKTEQTVLPGLQVAADLRGVNKHISAVKVTSWRKTSLPACVNAVHTPATIVPTGRRAHSVSADYTRDIAKLQIPISSDKKIPKHSVPESLFKQLMNKSLQSKSASRSETVRDSETSEPRLSTPCTQRKPRSVTASCSVPSVQTNGMYSFRKSGRLSAKQSPASASNSPRTRKFPSSPEIEQKPSLLTPSSTPVYTETTSRKNFRFSKLGVQFSDSVESSSGSPQPEGKGGSLAQNMCTSKVATSIRKSITSIVTQAAKSDKFCSESLHRAGYEEKPVSSSTPAYKQTASAMKSRDAGVVGSLRKFVDQNSSSVGLRTPAGSPAQKDYEMVSRSGSFLLKQVSEGPDSSGSKYSGSMYDPKSSEKRVHRLSRSRTSQNSVLSQTSVLAQQAGVLRNRSSLNDQVSRSSAYHTYLPSPGSQNTTFDFDSVETPCITVEDLVSPLSSNRKQKSLGCQDLSTNEQEQKSELAFKRQRMSERIGRNVTISGDGSVHSLPPQHLFTSVIDESVDTSYAEGKEWGSYNNSLSERLKTQSSYKSASPKFHGKQTFIKKASRISKTTENILTYVSGVQQLITTPSSVNSSVNMSPVHGGLKLTATPRTKKLKTDLRDVAKSTENQRSPKSLKKNLSDIRGVKELLKTPRDLRSLRNDLRNVSGVKLLMKTPKSPKSPKNDLRDVRGVRKLMTTPKSPKSPQNDLRDVRGVRKLMTMPKSPKSPKNDLRDVRGVRKLMTTPKSLKSPKNDLRDVCGVRKLMTTPKSPKSPKNDLRDVRGVRKLMTTPRSPQSPKNDLRDVRGVRKLMKTPRSPKSPKNDLRDVRGVRKLMTTPRSPKSPKNDLQDIRGVRKLMTTPKSPKSPKNDLTDVRGVRKLMTNPRSPKSPQNDLRDVRGMRKLMTTPRTPKSPKNDLQDIRGVKRLMATPKTIKSSLNDLTDVLGVGSLMTTPQVTKSPKNDLTDVAGIKDLTKTRTPRLASKGLIDASSVHSHGKTSLLQSPEFGGHASQTENTPNSPDRSVVPGVLPSVVTGTHHTRHCTKFINKVPETDISTEIYIDQENVAVPKDIKRGTTRSTRNRKEPNFGILQAEVADVSPKPPLKKPRQKKGKTESTKGVSPGRSLEISPGLTVTSVASRQVRWNIPDSPPTPGNRVTRRRNVATTAEMELPSLPPRTRKTVKSKGVTMTEQSASQEDKNYISVRFPSGRKTRGRQLTSAVEIPLSPTARKQEAGVTADVEVTSLPKQRRGITATAKVESPLPSKMQQVVAAKISAEESSSPRKRRGGTVNSGSKQSTPSKRLHVTVTEDSGATVTNAELTSRRRRRAAFVTEVEILQSPVTKKTRGKLAVRTAVEPIVSTVPSDLFSTSDKQPATEESPPHPGKRRKRTTKPVQSLSPVSARKLQGIQLTDVGEGENVSSVTETRSRKPRITSSPVAKVKSPPAVSRRGGRKTAKKEVSPQVTAGCQTRASSRRKK